MDPISALIGGVASLGGAFMNTSSQQSINAAQMQQAQYINTGQNLPQYYSNLVKGANAAGLSPLAVLGQRGPDVVANIQGTQPGAGLEQFGRTVAQIDPHQYELQSLAADRARIENANARQLGDNAAIQGERMRMLNSQIEGYIHRHPYAVPEGLQYPVTTDILEEMRTLGEGVSSGPSISKMISDRINSAFDALGGAR